MFLFARMKESKRKFSARKIRNQINGSSGTSLAKQVFEVFMLTQNWAVTALH